LAALIDGAGGEEGHRAVRELAALLGVEPLSAGELAEAAGDPGRRESIEEWGRELVERLGSGVWAGLARAMEERVPGSGALWYGGDHTDFRGGVFLREVIGVQVVVGAPGAPEALAALPGRPVGFTGRKAEGARLLAALGPGSGQEAVLVSAVSGLGGVGKTALAVETAHAAVARGWFPGGVLFLDLHGYDSEPVGPERALQYLLGALGVRPESVPGTLGERAALYRSALARRAATLVLADNASSVDQVRDLLPGDSRHRMLVTSRDRLPQLGARLVPLDQLTPQESYDLLDRALRIADPDDGRAAVEAAAVRQLAQLCGHLPLALQIVAALLVEDREWPVAELAEELAGSRDRLAGLDDGVRSVRAAFDLSYRRLTPEQARVLRLLSVAPGVDAGEGVLAALVGEDSAPLRELRALRRVHLVEREGKRWRSHDLVREFGAGVVEEGEEVAARERVLDFYWKYGPPADAWLWWLPGEERPSLFSGREEAMAWLDVERLGLVAAVQWGRAERFARGAMAVALFLAEYLRRRRAFDDMCSVMEVAREAAQADGHVMAEAVAWHSLGVALRELERLEEAVEAYRHARRLFTQAGDRGREATTLGHLGVVLAELGRFEEVVDVHTRACAVHAELGNRREEGQAWAYLGHSLEQLEQPEEAFESYTRARDIFAEVGDGLSEGSAWSSLAFILRTTGRLREAIAVHGKALTLLREFDDDYAVGATLVDLALAHEADDAPARAQDAFLQAAEAFTRADSPDLAAHCRARATALTAHPEPTDIPTPASPPAHTTAAAPPSPPPPNAPDTAER